MRRKIIKMILCALLCIGGTLCPNFIIQASEQIVEVAKSIEKREVDVNYSSEILVAGDWKYDILEDGTVRILSYLGAEKEVTIPEELDGKKVTCIGREKYGCYFNITKLTLPEGIVKIEDYAFASAKLQQISFPKSLKIIGADAFFNNKLSGNIIIPENVESVGDWAFMNCTDITEITIEEGASGFGRAAFAYCTGMTSVQVPKSVTEIPKEMFLCCYSLANITIPNTVTSIGVSAFASCWDLEKLVLPESVTSIGSSAFGNGGNSLSWGDGWLSLTVHNAECDIVDDEATLYNVNKIITHEGSTAHQYAEKYGITFVNLDNPFADVPKSGWEYIPVEYALEKGLMAGNGTDEDGKIIFKPGDNITREQFVQVIYSNSGKPEANIENKFPDVQNDWYTSAVLWANEKGIANGNGDGTFGVGQNITREQLALMLYKYAQMNGYDLTTAEGQINQYADGTMVSAYAKEALNWAITQGIISGKGTVGEDISTFRIDPQGTATRAECAAMVKKLLTNN